MDFMVLPQRDTYDWCFDDPDCIEEMLDRSYSMTQGVGFWNIELLKSCSSGDPPDILEEQGPGCQPWPDQATWRFDPAWRTGRAMAMASLLLGILAVLMFWGFSNIENDVDDPLLLGVFLLVGILSAQMLIGKGSSICGEESIAYIQSESGPFIAEWSVYSCRSGVGQKLAILLPVVFGCLLLSPLLTACGPRPRKCTQNKLKRRVGRKGCPVLPVRESTKEDCLHNNNGSLALMCCCIP
jgi:hypothetical protein